MICSCSYELRPKLARPKTDPTLEAKTKAIMAKYNKTMNKCPAQLNAATSNAKYSDRIHLLLHFRQTSYI